MHIALLVEDLALFDNVPETDLVDLAVDLDLEVPAAIDRAELLGRAVVALAQLARREGLPLSHYDREDLEALAPADLAALTALCGVRGGIDALIKQGEKTYKVYHRDRPRSQIPLLLPMLLRPLARHAAVTEGR